MRQIEKLWQTSKPTTLCPGNNNRKTVKTNMNWRRLYFHLVVGEFGTQIKVLYQQFSTV